MQLDHIVVLDLSKNQLTALPETFGELRSLKKLDLLGNELRYIYGSGTTYAGIVA